MQIFAFAALAAAASAAVMEKADAFSSHVPDAPISNQGCSPNYDGKCDDSQCNGFCKHCTPGKCLKYRVVCPD